MVEAKGERQYAIHYADWRKDKPASPGYSQELICSRVDPKYYDDLDSQPTGFEHLPTLLAAFESNVKDDPNADFLGKRVQQADGSYSDYQWMSRQAVDIESKNLAKGLMTENLAPEVEGEEGKPIRLIGLWSKNRPEWTETLLAGMHYRIVVVGFFDAMGAAQMDFILNQTQLPSMIVAPEYIPKVLQMKKDGQAGYVKNLISLGESDQQAGCEAAGIKLVQFTDVVKAGANASDAPAFEYPDKFDSYIFSYTSGTTGDSKGVPLTHNSILKQAIQAMPGMEAREGDAVISYLPYPHSFEQILLGVTLCCKLRVGFYQGDPLKLVEDCGFLKPAFFPSVPRLYTRIYSKIKSKFDAETGCKKWLIERALSTKLANLQEDGSVYNGCYDTLVFSKVAALLGGNVRTMATGSAPLDQKVLEFIKVCFSCPVVEGYGLTETATAGTTTDRNDPLSGHVGGPSSMIKMRLKDLPEMEYLSSDKPYPRGEICMTGPCIFSGYYKRPDKTADAFDSEGWFMTGDVGLVYPNGSVKIIDRSKNIFKLSQGEYIAPEKIENVFTLSKYIAQCFIYGDSLKNALVSVIVLEEAEAKAWAEANGKSDVCNDEEFKKVISEELLRLAQENKLTGLEKPKEFHLTLDLFSVENDILTPTFKLKRNVAKKVYQGQLDEMYARMEAKGM